MCRIHASCPAVIRPVARSGSGDGSVELKCSKSFVLSKFDAGSPISLKETAP